MSSSKKAAFTKAAKSPKPKRPAPFSIRLSEDERAFLARKAGNKPLGTYVRSTLLGDAETRRKPSRAPSIDYALLGQVLGMLGKSEQLSCLFMLLVAAEADRIELDESESQALRETCEDVREMRALLIQALGLRSETQA